MNPIRRAAPWFALAVAPLVLSACSGAISSSNDDDGGSASGPTGEEATAALEAAYTGETGEPPTVETSPPADVNLWVVSCGEQVPSCSTPVAGMKEAGELIGWNVTVCDGQLNPGGWGTCLRQATSAGADVVIPVGIDCVSVEAPMREAVDAGVEIVGGGGSDCTAVGGDSLLASERLQLPDTSIEDYWRLNGQLQADWLIGKSDGAAKVLLINFTDPVWGPWITAGFTDRIAECEECEIVSTLDLANSDIAGNTAAQKFSSALVAAPDVNAVSVPVGGWLSAGLAQAVQASGRANDLAVSAGFGDASTMDLVRSAGFDLGVLGYATEWGSYGSIDTAIRVLNGEEPQVQGDGFQMVDADNNLPAEGDYEPDVDYKAAYEALWGVS